VVLNNYFNEAKVFERANLELEARVFSCSMAKNGCKVELNMSRGEILQHALTKFRKCLVAASQMFWGQTWL
jgi:hypothetical protein